MKADDGLNLRAYGHSGFFPCPDALNGNRIIITPPQGWLRSSGRQPFRRERAASSHSFRVALRARGVVSRQRGVGIGHPSVSPERFLRSPDLQRRGHSWTPSYTPLQRGCPPKPTTCWISSIGRGWGVLFPPPRMERLCRGRRGEAQHPSPPPTRLLLLEINSPKVLAKAKRSERQPEPNLHNCQEFELLITTCKLPMFKV